jgi:ATP-dependent DNA helicase RecQ
LSSIFRTGQRFGSRHLIDVLRGHATERVEQWQHQDLSVFGIGSDLEESAWRDVFRQLVTLGFVRPDHASFGALRLTPTSRPVLKGEQTIFMRRIVARKGATATLRRKAATAAMPAADATILERLRAWRSAEARRQSVPAYVIFHDATLAAIAAARPREMEDFSSIHGIGAKKKERYGPALMALLGD